jgi:hypothetical protein
VLRRLYWLTVGTVLGAAATLWGLLRLRQAAARLTPTGMQAELVDAVRQLGADLRAAATEGVEGMREAEDRLRAQLATERTGGRGPRR